MPRKVWKASYEVLQIEFRNHWTFLGKSEEELLINGVVKDSRKANLKDGFRKSISNRFVLATTINEKNYVVEVKVGSKWLGLSTGCHIIVNGELVGGDVNSKLLFT